MCHFFLLELNLFFKVFFFSYVTISFLTKCYYILVYKSKLHITADTLIRAINIFYMCLLNLLGHALLWPQNFQHNLNLFRCHIKECKVWWNLRNKKNILFERCAHLTYNTKT